MDRSSKHVAFKIYTAATLICSVAAYSLDKFDKDGVVPDVIDKAPTQQLKLHYGSIDVLPGMVLTPSQVKDRPKVEYEAEKGAYYTLIMNDPDAPSRNDPVMGEWHHWLVTNIPGADLSKGEEVTQYVSAGPPKDTGLHRYVFLLYKQPKGKMSFKDLPKLTNQSGNRRAYNKVREFVKKYELEKIWWLAISFKLNMMIMFPSYILSWKENIKENYDLHHATFINKQDVLPLKFFRTHI